MKFLNSIDGANRLVEDTDHRLVTDAEKTDWNAKAEVSLTLNNTTDYARILAMSIALGG